MFVRIGTVQAAPERLPPIQQAMAHADSSDLREDQGYRGLRQIWGEGCSRGVRRTA